jgi:hypothetical protein
MIEIVLDQKQAKDSWNLRQELVKLYVCQRYGNALLYQ